MKLHEVLVLSSVSGFSISPMIMQVAAGFIGDPEQQSSLCHCEYTHPDKVFANQDAARRIRMSQAGTSERALGL